ncbi:glycosyl hydrolase [Methanoculleus sediminis]|uniref:Probable pectate lyase C n=1 Tax=Methanoculleus sediminis TaxID=1550566 RepID=A0A0H1R3E8_9EURY|nr:CARDB domain-containing protein [Methanoculleus sediminis]KLK89296.1 glycosyl hydrolase [Methanoculleus sediminis]
MRDRRTTKLLIAAFLIVGLIPIVGALEATPTTIVAASDSSAADKAAAAYVCDGVNDHVEIQAALNALPSSGGVVLLSGGTYNCAGIIAPKASSTLKGAGESETNLVFTRDGRINVDREYVTLDGFHIKGTGYSSGVKWLGVMNVRASHAKIHNITGTADASIQAVYLLIHDPTVYAPTLEDVEFVNCKAVDTGTYGFLHNAWGSTNMVIKNVRYDNCAAINCGKFGVFNPWITGFDFAELNDMDGLRVTNCLAEGNLESGFHFEFDPKVTNAVLENCVSRNNGQKAFPTKAYNPNDMSTHYFGCGYYAPNCDVTFINCVAEGNSMNGFYTTNGGKLYNCVEKDTGIGRTDFSYRVPAGYYSIPSRSVNPSTVMENCTSINSRAFGLQVDLANNVKIRNFHLIDPVGYNGKGSSLGGTNGQFDNSEVSIYASGNRVETLVWAKENVNTVFSGQIVSDSAKPFVIEGYRTQNVLVKDMEIVSKTLPAGSPGVTIVGTVPAGQATLQNVKVTSTGSSVPAPTPTATPTVPTTPAPSGKPDLVVTDISWTPANPATGNAVTMKATIKNQGDAPTPAGTKHGVLFTFDDGAAGSGVWSDAHTASIAPGSWVTVTANGGSSGATWKAVEGTHTVKAHVDDVNRIAESNDANNVRSEQITVSKTASGSTPTPTPTPAGKPDLVVTGISWTPANPASGDAVTMKATIKNQGTAPTPAGTKHGVLFTFDDGAAGPGVWSDTHTTALAPGASVTVTASGGSSGATWKAAGGTHTVKAHVDDVNRIAESNENNNVMSKEIVVGSLPVPVRGDLNGDGSVDWADVTIAAGMAQKTAPSDPAADFNGDGTVDWKDVALLADLFFGRTSSL